MLEKQSEQCLLQKNADTYLTLLVYRTTPLRCGFGPTQLLMGRNLRTVPSTRAYRTPMLVDCTRKNGNYDKDKRKTSIITMINSNK
jgi:hypothetical protein